jgi:hypothetical protein
MSLLRGSHRIMYIDFLYKMCYTWRGQCPISGAFKAFSLCILSTLFALSHYESGSTQDAHFLTLLGKRDLTAFFTARPLGEE